MLPEVSARSRLRAVKTIAEVDLIQVQLENACLGIPAFDLGGENQLLELPADRLLWRQEALTGKLLSDRAAALSGTRAPEIGQRGGHNADRIEAAMVVKTLILNRNYGMNQILRDL